MGRRVAGRCSKEVCADAVAVAVAVVKAGIKSNRYFRLAEEKWYSRFTSAGKKFYSEMGLVSISIVAFTGVTGSTIVDM